MCNVWNHIILISSVYACNGQCRGHHSCFLCLYTAGYECFANLVKLPRTDLKNVYHFLMHCIWMNFRLLQNVFRLQACNVENVGLELQDVSPEDWAKISALDWLNFYPTQRTELLIQANALVAYFLASSNVLAARMAFNKVSRGFFLI